MRKRLPALLLSVLLASGTVLTACSGGPPAPVEDTPAPAAVRHDFEAPAKPDPLPSSLPDPEPEAVFFTDVPSSAWYYEDVRTLFDLGALPERKTFGPGENCTRLEFVQYLYGVNLALGHEKERYPQAGYADVPAGTEGFEAVMWAERYGIVHGVSKTSFNPGGSLTREQCCTLLCRFADAAGIQLAAKSQTPEMFTDSLAVQEYARSYVAACRMAGLLSGYQDGSCKPAGAITHAEAAKLACSLLRAAKAGNPSGSACVDTSPDAYLQCYEELARIEFGQPVPESAPVDLSWFDNAVIVGDSVTVALQMYCASTRALGNAAFLSAGSLSALNNNVMAVGPKSVHPTYKGVKMKIEDGVAASGAKNVYIMLGMNNLYVGVDGACEDMVELIENIKAKSPDVNILIESMTPVAQGGSVLDQGLTNEKINQYNQAMQKLCQENRWYYIDVSSQFRDEGGWLKRDYCGDLPGMGIHFTFAGTKVWTDYLITHVPQALK